MVTRVLPRLGVGLLGSSCDWLAVGGGEVSVAVEEERNERMDGLQRHEQRASGFKKVVLIQKNCRSQNVH